VLWIKTLHILCVMAWLAGVFYLPRIFVNYAEAKAAGEPVERLAAMGFRLFRFASILGIFAIIFGLVLWFGYGISGRWLHWKLVFVALLLVYYFLCGRMVMRMRAGALEGTPLYFRVFNEVSVLIVFVILVFAVVKPV
jgi:putative membrane protein